MMEPQKRRSACDNLNHRREHVSIRNCPTCGDVVNESVGARQCNDVQHAEARRQQTVFCIHCGTRLVSER